jgi:hypothetical protein
VALKIIHIILLASVKYIITLPYAMIIGLEYKYAILAVLAGGIGGFLFFYYLSKPLDRGLKCVWPPLCKLIPSNLKLRYNTYRQKRDKKRPNKVFSKQSRFLVRTKTIYGYWGIILATPVILTIPIGAFLANKYYSHKRHIVIYMILSIVGWAGVLTGLIHLFPGIFFD